MAISDKIVTLAELCESVYDELRSKGVTVASKTFTAIKNAVRSIGSMGSQTINPSTSDQTVSCSGKYMTGNILVKAITKGTAGQIYYPVGSRFWFPHHGYVKNASTGASYDSLTGILGFGSWSLEGIASDVTIPKTNQSLEVFNIGENSYRWNSYNSDTSYNHYLLALYKRTG